MGLAPGHTGLAEVALGTVYDRAIFMLTVALGAVPRFSGVAQVCPKGRAWRALEVRSHRVATVARAAPLLS